MTHDIISAKCPVCRSDLDILLGPLMLSQARILEAIEQLKRDLGRLPSAPKIALYVERPVATVKLELQAMEHGRRVYRPNGPKSGWDIRREQDVMLVVHRRSLVA